MLLKKVGVQLPFSAKKTFLVEYDSSAEFTSGIVTILENAKVEKIAIRLPVNEDFDKELKQNHAIPMYNKGDFNFYVLPDIDFVKTHDFAFVQSAVIYSLEEDVTDAKTLAKATGNAGMVLVIDNYLELAKITIEMKRFGEAVPAEFFE